MTYLNLNICFSTPRQRSSAALASALYSSGPATGSFNSSGRSSNCDDGEMQDMHSDISIEDDVIDLNNKVRHSSFFFGLFDV